MRYDRATHKLTLNKHEKAMHAVGVMVFIMGPNRDHEEGILGTDLFLKTCAEYWALTRKWGYSQGKLKYGHDLWESVGQPTWYCLMGRAYTSIK